MAGLFRREFISTESKRFYFQLGKHLATALAGFIVGAWIALAIFTPFILRYCPAYLNKGF